MYKLHYDNFLINEHDDDDQRNQDHITVKWRNVQILRGNPERQSTDCTVRETDDVMDILVQIDERKLLSALPSFVADNSDKLSSPCMDVGQMHTIMNKIDKLEAILFGVQTAVYSPYDH